MAPSVQQPPRVSDELLWELLRDEWELLLAVGSGPTDPATAAERLGAPEESVRERIRTLLEHGLVRRTGDGYGLVTAYHQRREGMASYLRDVVLRRIAINGTPPLGGQVRYRLGQPDHVGALLRRAESELFPSVVASASGPESDRSERFVAVFSAASHCGPPPDGTSEPPRRSGGHGFTPEFLRVLRAAAGERARAETAQTAKLWVAEMRVDPEIADEIVERMDGFLADAREQEGPGTAAFAVWPARPEGQEPCL